MSILQPEIIFEDYRLWVDEATGAWVGKRISTNEEIDVDMIICPGGSKVKTPADMEADRELKEQRRKFLMHKEEMKRLGKFCFLAIENGFSGINAATAARLVYLSTFLKYGTDCLYLTKRTQMKKEHLPKVMGMSATTAFRFMKEACPQYIQEDEAGNLHLSAQIFRCGEMGKNNKHMAYQKIYIDMVRNLYGRTRLSNHKELGYIFAMLSYVNIEYNVLCKNPYEKDIEQIELMSVREFCEAIGHSYSTVSRLRETYSKIRFPVDGTDEQFCKFVSDGNNLDDAWIFVNPRIIYSGTSPEQVKIMGKFCKQE